MLSTLLHPHTGLPIRPLGYRKDGRPIWPIMGASEDDDAAADQGDDKPEDEDDEADENEDEGKDDLGDAGKKALDRMKARLKTERARRIEAEKKAAEKPAKKADDDAPVDVDKIRDEAKAEAKAEALKERVLDKIEAKARRFVDAEDAAAILLRSHNVDDFIDGDKIDADAIADALDELAEKKPHLIGDAQGGKRFGGGADGGPRKKEAKRAGSLAEAVGKKYAP